MSETMCWQAQDDEGAELSRWQAVPAPAWLRYADAARLMVLLHEQSGSVNGLPVIGNLQVVHPGDLVRVWSAHDPPVHLVVGRGQPESEPGNGRVCRFCGLPIDGEALRCSCGRIFCATIRTTCDRCPGCNRLFEADAPPSERLL